MLQKMVRFVVNDDPWLRAIHIMALGMFAFTYAIVIYGVIIEVPNLAQAGLGALVLDLGVRLGGGLLFSGIAAAPYVAASVASLRTGRSRVFGWLASAVCLVHFVLTVKVVYFPQSSTESVTLFFLPFYLGVPILVLWALFVAGVVGRPHRTTGS